MDDLLRALDVDSIMKAAESLERIARTLRSIGGAAARHKAKHADQTDEHSRTGRVRKGP